MLGQAIGGVSAGRWSPLASLIALAVAVTLTCAIVLLNDYSDRAIDALKRQLHPHGCSPKTIPDGILGAESVLIGGLAAATLCLAIAALAESSLGRPGLLLAATSALAIFLAYSFRPLRANYRGGGEYLEMLGVGIVLPWLSAYIQGGDPMPALAWALLPGLALLALASAVTSGLADEVSDRLGGKTTFASRYGNPFCRLLGENLLGAGALLWAFAARATPELLSPWAMLPAIVVLIGHWRTLVATSESATTNNFTSIRAYKQRINQAIARSTIVLAISLIIFSVLRGSP